jgi:hypothetical protein
MRAYPRRSIPRHPQLATQGADADGYAIPDDVVYGAVVIGAVAPTGAVTGFASSSRTQTVHIQTINPSTRTLDFPPTGKSPGDVYVFSATIVSSNGRTVVGRLRGTQTEIKLENGMETVQGMLTYELGAGNELVVGGISEYPQKGTGLLKGKRYVRPVLGGSGKYAGARGQVFSKQLTGGRYDQVFQLTY